MCLGTRTRASELMTKLILAGIEAMKQTKKMLTNKHHGSFAYEVKGTFTVLDTHLNYQP